MRRALFPLIAVAVAACGGSPPSTATDAPQPAAHVDSSTPEAQLARVTLSPEAEAHLALEIDAVTMQSVSPARTVGGEAVMPPGQSVVVSAPIAGTLVAPAGGAATLGPISAGDTLLELLPLQPADRDVRTEAERDGAETAARLTEATQRLARLEQLLQDGAASVRSVEEARATQTVAAAAAEAARNRLATVGRLPVGPRGEIALTAPFDGLIMSLSAAPGQTVAAGTPVAVLKSG